MTLNRLFWTFVVPSTTPAPKALKKVGMKNGMKKQSLG